MLVRGSTRPRRTGHPCGNRRRPRPPGAPGSPHGKPADCLPRLRSGSRRGGDPPARAPARRTGRRWSRRAARHSIWRVVGFSVVLTLLTALLFGLFPAMRLSAVRPSEAMREGTRHSGSRQSRRLWSGMVVVEVALAVVLLSGSAIMLRSFAAITSIDPGFQPDGVLTTALDLPEATYPTVEQAVAFHQRLLASLRDLPGVTAVGITNHLPLEGNGPSGAIQVAGKPRRSRWSLHGARDLPHGQPRLLQGDGHAPARGTRPHPGGPGRRRPGGRDHQVARRSGVARRGSARQAAPRLRHGFGRHPAVRHGRRRGRRHPPRRHRGDTPARPTGTPTPRCRPGPAT